MIAFVPNPSQDQIFSFDATPFRYLALIHAANVTGSDSVSLVSAGMPATCFAAAHRVCIMRGLARRSGAHDGTHGIFCWCWPTGEKHERNHRDFMLEDTSSINISWNTQDQCS